MDIGDEVRDEVSVVSTLLSSSSVCVGLFPRALLCRGGGEEEEERSTRRPHATCA